MMAPTTRAHICPVGSGAFATLAVLALPASAAFAAFAAFSVAVLAHVAYILVILPHRVDVLAPLGSRVLVGLRQVHIVHLMSFLPRC